MRLDDRLQATLIHATARFTVRYGNPLRFAGQDLPAPEQIKVRTRHGNVPVHLYGSGARTYVHFHGGAWLMRYPQMDDWWCRYVAATAGVAVANVDFRTGPYVTYPVAQEQCHDVAAHFAKQTRTAIGGFSSGGGLAASVALQARDAGTFTPTLQFLGVPALDLASDVPNNGGMINPGFRNLVRRVYFPDAETRKHPYASPLLATDLRGLPPAVICTAEHDSLRPDGDAYAKKLMAAGIPVEHHVTTGVDHYFLTADPTRARDTMAMIAGQIQHSLA